MNSIEDYKWQQRSKEWFLSKIGETIEYASLTVIKQHNKAGLIPTDVIRSERDAEYHGNLSEEYQWYYRITHIQSSEVKGLIESKK